jgi:hypothetical protein
LGIAPASLIPQAVFPHTTCVEHECQWLHYVCTAELASRPDAWRILAAAISPRAGHLRCTCASLNVRFAPGTACAGDVLVTPNVNGSAGAGPGAAERPAGWRGSRPGFRSWRLATTRMMPGPPRADRKSWRTACRAAPSRPLPTPARTKGSLKPTPRSNNGSKPKDYSPPGRRGRHTPPILRIIPIPRLEERRLLASRPLTNGT